MTSFNESQNKKQKTEHPISLTLLVIKHCKGPFPLEDVSNHLKRERINVIVTVPIELFVHEMRAGGFSAELHPMELRNVLVHGDKEYAVDQLILHGIVCVRVRAKHTPPVALDSVSQRISTTNISTWFLNVNIDRGTHEQIIASRPMEFCISRGRTHANVTAADIREALAQAPHMVLIPGTDLGLMERLRDTTTDVRLCMLDSRGFCLYGSHDMTRSMRAHETGIQSIGHAFTIPAGGAGEPMLNCVCSTVRVGSSTFVRVGMAAPQGGFQEFIEYKQFWCIVVCMLKDVHAANEAARLAAAALPTEAPVVGLRVAQQPPPAGRFNITAPFAPQADTSAPPGLVAPFSVIQAYKDRMTRANRSPLFFQYE